MTDLSYQSIELYDGDIIDLAYTQSDFAADTPIVLLLHGLEGSADSRYIQGMLAAITAKGWRGIVMHQRGCGPTPSRLARSYHALATEDFDQVYSHVSKQFPNAPISVIGYSLGGAILLNWLASASLTELTADRTQLFASVAVSVPIQLASAAKRMQRGLSKIYQQDLVKDLRAKIKLRQHNHPAELGHINTDHIIDFFDLDNIVTGPLHGFSSADDYYAQASPKQRLKDITSPTLIIHAADDPFMLPDCTPNELDISSSVKLAVYPHGGHVGFVSGKWPWKPRYWLEETVPDYFQFQLENG